MKNLPFFLFLLLFPFFAYGQTQADLTKSVPLWLDFDTSSNESKLRWIGDDLASTYTIGESTSNPNVFQTLGTVSGATNEFSLGILERGEKKGYRVIKSNANFIAGFGFITLGIEVPAIHQRGRCLILVDDILEFPLENEIEQLIADLEMDGWEVNMMTTNQAMNVVEVKSMIVEWYNPTVTLSHSVFLLGHVPVPYSGNSAYDGHSDHQGAWSADTFYGEIDGNWTDFTVNNTSPSRDVNKNVPGDGKYDQTQLPSDMEIEIGRVDFHNLPAFMDDEIELTRKYLVKDHEFRIGNKEYPRRAIVENNFGGFEEGFGQSAWRSYVPMLGPDSVQVGNYDVVLETDKYLCSYACGGGSYSSAAGIGSTANLWAVKDIKTIFTLNFGSYFGDWDSQNNFLRSALGSGDVLCNAWAGRPVWHLYPMALGQHIGVSARFSQNANGSVYNQGFGAHSTHMALMGDPTLRLHAMKPAKNLNVSQTDGEVNVDWEASPDEVNGYFVYRRIEEMDWELISEFQTETNYLDLCVPSNSQVQYMVKAIRLEETGSGSYYNTSLGITGSIIMDENPNLVTFYVDADNDGFGDSNFEIKACEAPSGYVDNNLDCDDANGEVNPDAVEIIDNGIDDDCDGEELVTGILDFADLGIKVFPNPVSDWLFVENLNDKVYSFKLYSNHGQVMLEGQLGRSVYIGELMNGVYWMEIFEKEKNSFLVTKRIAVQR